ncbi:hypothetical protein ACIQVO_37510 [Streptomyces sp. NPDC101062]|uniref:hypothetical protein n=1 Tax=unclassified Streptomyces TaxID=2593676 RepID=UPI0038242BED
MNRPPLVNNTMAFEHQLPGPPTDNPDRATVRAGSYNIKDGGGDRWPGQMKAVATLGLDLLGIQEAKHWDRDRFKRMYEAASTWGMQPIFTPSASHGCHLVLFYKWPRLQG